MDKPNNKCELLGYFEERPEGMILASIQRMKGEKGTVIFWHEGVLRVAREDPDFRAKISGMCDDLKDVFLRSTVQ